MDSTVANKVNIAAICYIIAHVTINQEDAGICPIALLADYRIALPRATMVAAAHTTLFSIAI